jgi:hypothetical protein
MACVTTVRYSVRFNNVALESFVPSRGVQQGDPLSPYLLLFVADGLSKLIQDQVHQRNIEELHICRRAPGISHLLFVDDMLLFIKAIEDQAIRIKEVLLTYERGTGQQMNPMKCSMMFGSRCQESVKARVLQILQVPNTMVEERYLGLPTPDGRMNDGKFKTTKQRLTNRCSSWVNRNICP